MYFSAKALESDAGGLHYYNVLIMRHYYYLLFLIIPRSKSIYSQSFKKYIKGFSYKIKIFLIRHEVFYFVN